MHAGATRDASEIAVAFTRVLRGAGLNVPTSSTIAFGEAIACTGIEDRDTTYWAGRATPVRLPEAHDLGDDADDVGGAPHLLDEGVGKGHQSRSSTIVTPPPPSLAPPVR